MSEPKISPHVPRVPYITPDVFFPTDNEYGIPCLKPDYCADYLDMPVEVWGRKSRSKKYQGTVHFYTECDSLKLGASRN